MFSGVTRTATTRVGNDAAANPMASPMAVPNVPAVGPDLLGDLKRSVDVSRCADRIGAPHGNDEWFDPVALCQRAHRSHCLASSVPPVDQVDHRAECGMSTQRRRGEGPGSLRGKDDVRLEAQCPCMDRGGQCVVGAVRAERKDAAAVLGKGLS